MARIIVRLSCWSNSWGHENSLLWAKALDLKTNRALKFTILLCILYTKQQSCWHFRTLVIWRRRWLLTNPTTKCVRSKCFKEEANQFCWFRSIRRQINLRKGKVRWGLWARDGTEQLRPRWWNATDLCLRASWRKERWKIAHEMAS